MFWVLLLACNILAGAAIALAFRPLMIVALAPVLLIATIVLLVLLDIGFWPSVLTLVACLIVCQASFALTSMLTRSVSDRKGATSVRELIERLRKCLS